MPDALGNAELAALLREPAVRRLAVAAGETECHLVGGVLRDRLLGVHSPDLDAVVAGRGRELAERLAAELPARLVPLGGKDFAAYRLVADGLVLDLWDRAGTSLQDDLARRDFTVNSMALAVGGGADALSDPFGGRGDLAARRLRATTPESFAGDPLRILRLARLLVQLPAFTAEERTVALAGEAARLLPLVAAERIRVELGLIFAHPEAHRGLALLARVGLYPRLWLGQSGTGDGGARHAGDARAARAAVTDLAALPACAAEVGGEIDLPTARLALTFSDLPATPGGALQALGRFREAGYLPHASADAVAALLALARLPRSATARRRFLHRAGPRWATALCVLGARAQRRGGAAQARWRREAAALARLARDEGSLLFSPPRLLDGSEVRELLGLPAGPEIGRALAALTTAQVDAKVRTREEAIRWLRRRQTRKRAAATPDRRQVPDALRMPQK